MMIENYAYLIDKAVVMGLILFGFYVVYQGMRSFMFPQKKGVIVSIGGELDAGEYSCKNCVLMPTEPGKSAIPLSVRLNTGEMCGAEISPCSLCMDKIKVGDPVGLTKTGSRIIAQKISKIHIRGA